ncbi:MAG: hypothetical protein WB770_00125 [Acidimicrobiales bacterium]
MTDNAQRSIALANRTNGTNEHSARIPNRNGVFAPKAVSIERSNGVSGSLVVPGSKSGTSRTIVICSLAKGSSDVSHGLAGGDATSMANGLKTFGATVIGESRVPTRARWRTEWNGGHFPDGPRVVDAELAGTTPRFLTAGADAVSKTYRAFWRDAAGLGHDTATVEARR